MTTKMNYYLGVKTLRDAANAIDELSFMEVLDKSKLQVQITNTDRIKLSVGPASKDNDLSKGCMIYIAGSFISSEMEEINNLSKLADKSVTTMVVEFVARQTVAMKSKGISATHMILGQKIEMNNTDESVETERKEAVNSKKSPDKKLMHIIIGAFLIILGVGFAISGFSLVSEVVHNISKYGIHPGTVGQILGFFLILFVSYIFITYGYKKIRGKNVKEDTSV